MTTNSPETESGDIVKKLEDIERKIESNNNRSGWFLLMAVGAGFVAAAVPDIQNQWWMGLIGIFLAAVAVWGYKKSLPID